MYAAITFRPEIAHAVNQLPNSAKTLGSHIGSVSREFSGILRLRKNTDYAILLF